MPLARPVHFFNNSVHAHGILHGIRVLNASRSPDEFDTGLSSLAYLQRFALATLTIDCGYVADINRKHTNATITGDQRH